MSLEEKVVDSASVKATSSDVEADLIAVEAPKEGLKRQMKNRHIAMIRSVERLFPASRHDMLTPHGRTRIVSEVCTKAAVVNHALT